MSTRRVAVQAVAPITPIGSGPDTFAKAFARIHHANLINMGIVPLTCDTDAIDQGDQLEIDVSNLDAQLILKNLTKGTELPISHSLSAREKEMLRLGGLLAYTAAQGN